MHQENLEARLFESRSPPSTMQSWWAVPTPRDFGRQFGKRFQRTKEKDKWYHGIMLRPDGGDPDADS